MPTVTFQIVGLDKAIGAVREAVLTGVDAGLGVTGARGQELVVQNITSPYLSIPPRVATGNLAGSIAFQKTSTVDISRVEILAQPPADAYAAYVETGMGPHFPSVSALIPWVEKKFNTGDEKKAKAIAFLIARKIAKRGVSGFGMFARALNVLQTELKGIFERAIGEQLQRRGLGN